MSGSAVYAGAITDLIPAESLMTGHFTQMMQATATQIGCAALKCSELGATGETMLSPQNRWVVSCRYDVGNTRDNYPFSERAAAAFTRDMETSDPSDDAAACYIPCDGPMTPAERAAFVAIDDQVPLADAPTDYVAPGSPNVWRPNCPEQTLSQPMIRIAALTARVIRKWPMVNFRRGLRLSEWGLSDHLGRNAVLCQCRIHVRDRFWQCE